MSIVTDRPTLSTRVNPAAFASVRWEIVVVAVSSHIGDSAIKECLGRIPSPAEELVGKNIVVTSVPSFLFIGLSRFRLSARIETIDTVAARRAGRSDVGAVR